MYAQAIRTFVRRLREFVASWRQTPSVFFLLSDIKKVVEIPPNIAVLRETDLNCVDLLGSFVRSNGGIFTYSLRLTSGDRPAVMEVERAQAAVDTLAYLCAERVEVSDGDVNPFMRECMTGHVPRNAKAKLAAINHARLSGGHPVWPMWSADTWEVYHEVDAERWGL